MSASKRSCLVGFTLATIVALAATILSPAVGAAAPVQTPSASQAAPNLVSDSGWTLLQPMVGNAAFGTTRTTGPDGNDAQALRVVVNTTAPQIYNIQLSQLVSAPIPADHLLRYQFWARAATPHFLHAVVEMSGPPYTSYVGSMGFALTPDWKKYVFTDDSPGIPANGCAARLQLGSQTGSVEFADVRVLDLGLDPTVARDKAALEPAAIQARIRQYRMADLTVRVVDSHGRPVPNARITVAQKRHAFLFGCNIFGLRDIDNDSTASPADWQLQQSYRTRFAALFNYATLPFYWGSFEPQPGQTNFPQLTWMAQWCQDHGIATKAHPLVWQEVYPSWAPSAPDQAIPLLHKRVTDIIDNMSGLTRYYDVINETIGASTYAPADGESLWVRRDGPANVTAAVLSWAHSAAQTEGGSADRFIVNDYDTSDAYANLFRQLQARNSLPDIIGIQSHMHTGVWPMRKVWDVCERFGRFGIPIHFTETTVLSSLAPHALDYTGPSATDWPTTPSGETAQAAYVEQFYTLLFSHPAVHAITWWDFSDRDAWLGAPAGLLRPDMSPKPAYNRLIVLIKHKWWTNAAGRSNASGSYTTHAFYGDYNISATSAHGKAVTQHLTWSESSGPKTITLTLP